MGESLLRLFCKPTASVPESVDHGEWTVESALTNLRAVDSHFDERIKGKTIVDFGSGLGFQSAALLQAGAARVLGIENLPERLEASKKLISQLNLSERAKFYSSDEAPSHEKYGFIISQNAMEHFPDPKAALSLMRTLLQPDGVILITFGPPWYAPFGAHMQFFTNLPWVHLLFCEKTIMSVRHSYRHDGATRYEDVPGGLNRMSVKKFERLIQKSGLVIARKRYDCVKKLKFLAWAPGLRELFINRVTVLLQRS